MAACRQADQVDSSRRRLRVRLLLLLFLSEASALLWVLRQDPLGSSLFMRNTGKPAGGPAQDYAADLLKDPALRTVVAPDGFARQIRRLAGSSNAVLLIPVGDCASCMHVDLPRLRRKAAERALPAVLLTSASAKRARDFVTKAGLAMPILADPEGKFVSRLNVAWLGRAYLISRGNQLKWLQTNWRPDYDLFEDPSFTTAASRKE